MENTKGKVLSGLIWKFSERICAQSVSMIVSIVIARIIDPSAYGAIALVNVFIALADTFVSSSFGSALIQKKDADATDFSSVFYFNIFLGLFFYIVIFISAPYIALFYDMPILSPVLRFMGIRLIVAGINSVQHAYVSKTMAFKRFFWSTLGGTLGSAVIGIAFAYFGMGVWALAAQYMFNSVIDTIVLWFTVRWRPKKIFSFKRLRIMFSYGWKLLASGFLETGYNELRSLLIGKIYTSSDLAFYNKGKSFPDLVVTNINSSIQSVLFPVMASEQDKKEQVRLIARRSIRISSYIMLPVMCGLALVAEPMIKLLLTEKWLPCVPYLQIACITYAFMPIHTANLQAIKAVGRSDIFLKLEITKKLLSVFVLCISVRFGVLAIALSGIITTFLTSIINAYPNKELIKYGYIQQMNDMFNGIVPLIIMMIFVIAVDFLPLNALLCLIFKVLVGVFAYISISAVMKLESFCYVFEMLKSIKNRRKI